MLLRSNDMLVLFSRGFATNEALLGSNAVPSSHLVKLAEGEHPAVTLVERLEDEVHLPHFCTEQAKETYSHTNKNMRRIDSTFTQNISSHLLTYITKYYRSVIDSKMFVKVYQFANKIACFSGSCLTRLRLTLPMF